MILVITIILGRLKEGPASKRHKAGPCVMMPVLYPKSVPTIGISSRVGMLRRAPMTEARKQAWKLLVPKMIRI
jgi:hypothetical protein